MGAEEDLQNILHMQVVAMKNGIDVGSDAQSLSTFVPKTKVNMSYICGAVLFDDNGNVLLIQEAKKSCLGTWYLPAGRLEPGETIIHGAKREVREESGLECDLNTLLSVEINSYKWMRFIFLGKITGGKLKTVNEKDNESLQAKFFSREDLRHPQTSLRHDDILKLIELGRNYWASSPGSTPSKMVPVIAAHNKLINRVVIIDRSSIGHLGSEQVMHLLTHIENGSHIPTALINYSKDASIAVSVYAVLRDAFAGNLSTVSVRMCGVLGVEHRGTGVDEDGICITTLVCLDLTVGVPPPPIASQRYEWCAIRYADLIENLGEGARGKIVPLL